MKKRGGDLVSPEVPDTSVEEVPPVEEVPDTSVEEVPPVEDVPDTPVEEVPDIPVEEVPDTPVEEVPDTSVEEVPPIEDVPDTQVTDVPDTSVENKLESRSVDRYDVSVSGDWSVYVECSGSFGEDITIKGNGPMKDFSTKPHWASIAEIVIVEEGVTRIGANSFSDTSNLKSVIVNGTTPITVGKNAFANCQWLNKVIAPNCVELEDRAFYNCPNVGLHKDRVNFLGNVQKIGKNSLSKCKYLTNLRLPNLTEISEGAFEGDADLQALYAPKITEIPTMVGLLTVGHAASLYVVFGILIPKTRKKED